MKKTKHYSFQERIARSILLQTCACCVVYCIVLLAVMGVKLYEAMHTTIDYHFFVVATLESLATVCIGTLVMFVALYFISRRVAKRTIQPLQEALEREKSFTSYASHEFRTPLAVLKGSMEVLIRKPRTQEEYERKIAENIKVVDGMNAMVDSLLTLTRLENGKIHLHSALHGVKDMLIESCSNHSDAVMRRKLQVDFALPTDDLMVRVDRNALMTILNNLVANAVKYCNEGGRITFHVRRDDGKTVIGVENTGRGIPQSETTKVFDQFYRSIRSGDQRMSGYGLGLAIVRHFADLIGAEVTFTSCEEGPTLVEVAL